MHEDNRSGVFHHPHIRFKERNSRFDGTHLSDTKDDIYLNNSQWTFDSFLSSAEYQLW